MHHPLKDLRARLRRSLAALPILAVLIPPAGAGVLEEPVYTEWRTFTTRDGLPADKAFAVRIDGERVWVGTARGLARFEDGRWRSWGPEEGLPHPVVLALDVSPRTGDLWIGTMGGLARFSGGRFDAFTQTNSGLPNDFVHAVRCDPLEDAVWAATAMGAARLDLRTGAWSVFDHRNTPMFEPWTYSLAVAEDAVYIGAWGAGVLEYDRATGRWREFRDPDREFELDLFPDDGPVSDVTSAIDYADGLLWHMTYTGAGRYDGREWRSYFTADSGLASDFINFVRARGRQAWIATDQGLSHTDGDEWATYRRTDSGGEVRLFRGGREVGRRNLAAGPAHNYVLGVDVAGDEVWVATGAGVSRGARSGGEGPAGARLSAAGEPTPAPAPATEFRYAGTPDALHPYGAHRPYRDFFTERARFRGPGREAGEPAGIEEVRIGFIGPLAAGDLPALAPGARPAIPEGDPRVEIGRGMLRAAGMAVEAANRDGGYRGLPFRVVPRTDLVLWGQTSNELVRFVLEDDVWAVLSAIDSNHNHVLSRASLKLEVPVVNAGSTDPTLVEHSIPWLTRCINDDRQNAYALLHEIFLRRGLRRVAVLRLNDRDGRTGVTEFLQGARRLGHPVILEKRFQAGDTDFSEPVASIRSADPDGIVLWGNPAEAAAAVRQIRLAGMGVPVFGFDRMARAEFLRLAGDASEGVVVAATMNPDREDPAWRTFRDRYREGWGSEPDAFAAHAYDGTNLLIEAIRKAGLNRARIGEALRARDAYAGVTGEIRFDTNMNDIGPPWLAVVRDGRFHYFPAAGWEEGAASTRTPAPAQP